MEDDGARKSSVNPRLIDTLKSRHDDRRATVERSAEAHERRPRGSTEPRSKGTNLGEASLREERPVDPG
jgi:hypothetical protein